MSPVIDDLADRVQGEEIVVKLDVDENYVTAKRYNILTIPSYLLFYKGHLIDRFGGVVTRKAIEHHLKHAMIE